MRSPEIRERFLNFFDRRGHHRLPSAPLVPRDDPTVLFTVAGMVPLQPYFRGTRRPPSPRIVSCQKCLRTPDLEIVGDATHHTFFEMLGNFSFGDYFKEGAITLAWTLLTEDFGLDADRLYPSVHPGDAEALRVWVDTVGVAPSRVSLLEDNFWGPAGPSGPCGFDSEIYFDWGPPCSCGRGDCRPDTECGGDRWTEVWNLVFPEFDQAPDGTRAPLPAVGIDTGMGLERITAVLQGVRSNYETDLFRDIREGFRARCAAAPPHRAREFSLNVLSDHLRSAAFLVAGGVLPGSESRGYVLRRIIRRAAVHGRRLGLRGGLAEGVGDLVAVMGDAYPELVDSRVLVESRLRAEEEAFARTVAEGSQRLDALLSGGTELLAGDDAFQLHDTHGFPIELTEELAHERGVEVDRGGFDAAMTAQRERARARIAQRGFQDVTLEPTTFVGYDRLEVAAEVVRVGLPDAVPELGPGETGAAVIEPSPFYAESGGQVGDTGVLLWDGGEASVEDAQLVPGTGAHALTVRVEAGSLRAGTRVDARVDAERRGRTMRHHSATHLLHRALREVLGEGVVQRGSWVGPQATTFDFNFPRGLTVAELADVQHVVNDAIRRDLVRTAEVLPVEEARRSGAVMLFDEKYGATVRVVDFGGWSRELCGGTHVERTGQIGAAMLTGEQSIGAGLRRIEMLAGEAAERRWSADLTVLRETALALRARPEELPARVAALQRQLREAQRAAADERRRAALGGGTADGVEVEEIAGLRLGHRRVEGGQETVKAAVDSLFADRLQGRGVAVVVGSDKVAVKAGPDAIAAGASAGDLVRAATEAAGGRGGGRPDFATGGIPDPARAEAALEAVRGALRELAADPR